ncbi:hypothetical protein QA640_12950 [Bradyrhizobium sp. CB82]|uniref:hypothetical protein n=1 Tax=Bradyrhizobium sp. CB82 TaxID=3039159 RepID=UPI0024B05E5E|nr:hypothetical protein [Bradyrhizobium sp. CB82]WFU43274.1 hypothetical protein QA640_12950 [Bradyrhizobium sp. CB82]
MRTIAVGALWIVAMITSANAAIKEEPVTYTGGETTMKGFDDAVAAKRPGIVMDKVDQEAKAEAAKFFAADLQK